MQQPTQRRISRAHAAPAIRSTRRSRTIFRRLKIGFLVCLISGLVALPATSAPRKTTTIAESKTVIVAGDPVAGKLKSEDLRCQECHAASDRDHSNAPEFKPATLAGQYPEYIVKQMH